MGLALLCSGQAGQRCDMLDGIFAAPECRPVLAIASEVLGTDVVRWWRGLEATAIFRNDNAQFAIALYQVATWTRVAAVMPAARLIAGYSLGEVLAYFVAGALDAEQTLRLVRERARLMDAAASGMASAGGCMVLWRGAASAEACRARDRAMAACGLEVAIRRSGSEMVLAGAADGVDRFLADPEVLNPQMLRLPVTTPSHTARLAPAAEAFRAVLEASPLAAPRLPVLGGTDGRPVRSRQQAVDALSGQIAACLRWDRCMETLAENGIDTVIELGPGSDLCKLLDMEHPAIAARSLDAFADPRRAADWLAARQA